MRAAKLFALGVLVVSPLCAFADASATIGALSPGPSVGVNTPLSFSVVTTGLTAPLSYILTDSFPGGANNSNIDHYGNFSWAPNRDDIGAHTIAVAVIDANGTTATAAVNVTVVAPTVSTSGLMPGTTVTFGNPLSFSVSSLGFIGPSYTVGDSFARSSLNFNSLRDTSFYWIPLLQDIGSHHLTITATDIQGHVASTSLDIVVDGIPTVQVPALTNGGSVAVGNTLSFTAVASGFTQPSFSVVDQFYANPASSTLKLTGATASWVPVYNDLGGHLLVVSATDAAGHSASTRVLVIVLPAGSATQPTQPTNTGGAGTTGSSAGNTGSGTSYVFKTYLGVGSRGAAVVALQQKLTALGYFSGEATGYFGNLTASAVKKFQQSMGLEQVGFVGPGTRAALNK